MKKLNKVTAAPKQRPVRILQFGEGNFLRAFFDWMIDISNEKGVTDTAIAVVTPRFGQSRSLTALQSQDSLYHLVLEGIADGKPRREIRMITSIAEAFSPSAEMERYDSLVTSPDLQIVVSNTTEAGIRYEPDDISSSAPHTFPGKVTSLLYKRYRAGLGGLLFLCCELIEDNGTTLKQCVIRHASEAGLEEGFMRWIDTECDFCDTLVDRIVSGFPADSIDEIKSETGYDDNAVVKGELYHLWAIGGPGYEKARRRLPLDQAGLNVLFMPSIKAFRDKKVRILNGSHTALVPIALQLGCQTVLDAFSNSQVNAFINDMVSAEVLPVIEGDPDGLRVFASSILERFYNPYIKHQLTSIALNSLSKWEARNWSTVKDNYLKTGRLAEREIFAFAALLSLYGPGSGFTPQDNAAHITAINEAWNPDDYLSTVRAIVSGPVFIEKFDECVPGFAEKTAAYLTDIRAMGMEKALRKNFAY